MGSEDRAHVDQDALRERLQAVVSALDYPEFGRRVRASGFSRGAPQVRVESFLSGSATLTPAEARAYAAAIGVNGHDHAAAPESEISPSPTKNEDSYVFQNSTEDNCYGNASPHGGSADEAPVDGGDSSAPEDGGGDAGDVEDETDEDDSVDPDYDAAARAETGRAAPTGGTLEELRERIKPLVPGADASALLRSLRMLGLPREETRAIVADIRKRLKITVKEANKLWADAALPSDERVLVDAGGEGTPPDGFANVNGYFCRLEGGNAVLDKKEWIPMCGAIEVLGLVHNHAGVGWGRLVRFDDYNGKTHEVLIPSSMLANDTSAVLALLLDEGLPLHDMRPRTKNAIIEAIARWTTPRRWRTVARLGWTPDMRSFVLGDGRVIGAPGVRLQSNSSGADFASTMRAKGTLDGWKQNVAARCVGNALLIVAVCAALAGPALDLLALDGGGIHFHGDSSLGKSTAQLVAASGWGSPEFKRTWRTTSNGLEGVALVVNGTTLILDEIGEVQGKDLAAGIYMLANGSGKGRANAQGAARATATWKTIIISSGEMPIGDKIAESGVRARAGVGVRVLDLSIMDRAHGVFDVLHGEADGAALSRRLKHDAACDYGFAGPAFVEHLADDLDYAIIRLRKLIADFHAKANAELSLAKASGQVQRAADRFALFAAAGELAIEFGVLPWPKGEATTAAVDSLGAWITARGGVMSAEKRDAVDRTRTFLLAHGDSRFKTLLRDEQGVLDESHARVVSNMAGWVDDDHFWITAEARRAIHAGYDPTAAARAVNDAGMLTRDAGVKDLTRKAPSAIKNRPRCYCVKRSRVGGLDDSDSESAEGAAPDPTDGGSGKMTPESLRPSSEAI
jgi:putative DNA primase/helicase